MTLFNQLTEQQLVNYKVLNQFPLHSAVMYQTSDGPQQVRLGHVASFKLNEFSEILIGIQAVGINPDAPVRWVHHSRVERV